MKWKPLLLLLGSVLTLHVLGQTQATPLVTQAIDEARVVALRGNVHPLAQARYDAGAADTSMSAGRLTLLLNRPADREAALAEYMQSLHAHGAANYHQWFTPEEFGNRFGPADSDIQQVSQWLTANGFQVSGISKSKTMIEFSGTVGQVNSAFRTQIHKYVLNSEAHYANAADPQIPQALAGIVRQVSSLNNFRPRPNLRVVGAAHLDPATRKISPNDTLNGSSGPFFGIGPADFATQYDLAPLYAAGINGAGKTIGIINDSNIDVNLNNAYRSMFNLSTNPAQIVLDGGDPGLNADDTEAYLDVEVAGAVAPAATVNLYLASWDTVADALDDPLILAARRAIDDNQADVLSVSFGNCEAALGAADNQILDSLWEQAAAQGQTIFVSSGDNGSAGCDNDNTQFEAIDGLQVNGFASTPWNIAVGGTDFYYSDYASGAPSAATFWNTANDANLGSLKAPLPEQVWNDAYGFNAQNPSNTNNYIYNIVAASGGASSCINSIAAPQGSTLPFVCDEVSSSLYGYSKPGWQNVPGVPADGARDLPDVSLFAANGDNLSAYVICASPGDCVPDANKQIPVSLVGGTSASTPAMAAIMALIDQKYGRQGQANYTLYPLSQQKPSAFHDITMGGDNVPCVKGSPNCVLGSNTNLDLNYTLSGYAAAAGYDLASGLGSIDANVLVSNWNSLTFAATTTSLQLSSTSFAHGTPVTLNTSVASSSGSTAPQGAVSILATSPSPSSQSIDLLTLDAKGAATSSIESLPGGTYQLWANYGGDGVHAPSYSSPVSVTVTPQASNIGILAWNTYSATPFPNPANACTPVVGQYETSVANGSSIGLGGELWLTVHPRAPISNMVPSTGSVTFTLDGQPTTVPLNVSGIATWAIPPTLNAGPHSVTASYSGDASYNPSTSTPFTFTVAQWQPQLGVSPGGVYVQGSGTTYNAFAGDTYIVPVFLHGGSCVLPTGAITVSLGTQTQNVTLSPEGYPAGQVLAGTASFPNIQVGTYPVSAAYSGDKNYQAVSNSNLFSVIVAPATGPRFASTTSIAGTSSILTFNAGSIAFTTTVTGAPGSTKPPTGTVYIYGNGEGDTSIVLSPSGSNTASGISEPVLSNAFSFGINQITAVYSGDATYGESISSPIPLTIVTSAVTPDFTLVPQLNQVAIQPGSSTTLAINLAPFYGFTGPVALTCTPSSGQVTCSLNSSTVMVNGQASTTLTITTAAQSSALATPRQRPHSQWPAAAGMLAFGMLLISSRAHRRFRHRIMLSLCIFATTLVISCGGSGSAGSNPPPPTTPPPTPPPPTLVTYSVVVTGTANGLTHNAKITVAVP